MRILVCGSRHYGFKLEERNQVYNAIFDAIEEIKHGEIEIISGMASGVDTAAVNFAIGHDYKLHKYPADWEKYGKAAGSIRNKQMLVEGKPDLVIAFWDGESRGTKNMIDQATKAGVPIKVISI